MRGVWHVVWVVLWAVLSALPAVGQAAIAYWAQDNGTQWVEAARSIDELVVSVPRAVPRAYVWVRVVADEPFDGVRLAWDCGPATELWRLVPRPWYYTSYPWWFYPRMWYGPADVVARIDFNWTLEPGWTDLGCLLIQCPPVPGEYCLELVPSAPGVTGTYVRRGWRELPLRCERLRVIVRE